MSESLAQRSQAASSVSDANEVYSETSAGIAYPIPPAGTYPIALSVQRRPVGSRSNSSQPQISDLPEVVTPNDLQGEPSDTAAETRPVPPGSDLPEILPQHSHSSIEPETATPDQPSSSKLDAQQLSEWQPVVQGPRSNEQKSVQGQDSTHRSPTSPEGSSFISTNGSRIEEIPLLVKAARDAQLEVVQTLLTNGVNVNVYEGTSKRTALMEASLGGHAAIVEVLIQHGCSLDSTDKDSFSALHHAAAKGHPPVANILLNNGASINTKGPGERTPLHVSLAYPETAMLLLRRGSDVNARDSLQNTPLHTSASIGNAEVCDILISQNAHLEGRDGDMRTPLQIACEAGHLDVVQLLLKCSKVKPKDPAFQSALFAAIESGNVSVVSKLWSTFPFWNTPTP